MRRCYYHTASGCCSADAQVLRYKHDDTVSISICDQGHISSLDGYGDTVDLGEIDQTGRVWREKE